MGYSNGGGQTDIFVKRIGKQTYYCKCSWLHIKIPILNIAMDDPKEDRKTDILL